jgi:PilZ domain
LKYTTVGDTVNVASRLESFEKDLTVDPYFKRSPCRILIEETTLQYVGKEFRTQMIGEVVLKGRVQKIRIYRVLGREDGAEPYASLRDAPRIKVETTVGITAEGLTVQVPTYDLSTGGLAVYKLPVQVEKGQIVRIELALAANVPPVVVSAKVAWSAESRAAFAFLDLQPEDRAAIETFLAPLVPSRKRRSPELAET